VENWHRELTLWLPELTVETYNGSQKEREELRRHTKRNREDPVDVWITTYTYFERESCKDDRQFLYSLPFHVCVYDEAHAIKNTESQRYQSLLQLQSRRRLLLSGTPVQNKLDELFALLSFCLPSIFNPKKSKLRKRVFGMESDPERVRRILSPFILRRLKSQVLSQLSPKTEEVILIKMLNEQQAMYDQVLKDFAKFKQQSERERAGKTRKNASTVTTSESVFTELRKIANHPLMAKRRFGTEGRDLKFVAAELHREKFFGKQATLKMVQEEIETYSDWDLNGCCLSLPHNPVLQAMILPEEDMFECSAKAAKLRELIPGLVAKGHRILLFSQWTKLLDIFEEMMRQISIPFMRLDGSTAVDERQSLVDGFNNGLAPIFLLSTRAGGLGINLTSADVVILHDLDFNPTIDSQAMDRCHRIGQTKKVRVIKLVAQGTVDEAIYKIQMKKNGLNKVVLGEDGSNEIVLVDDSSPDNVDGVLLPSSKDFAAGVQEEMNDEDKNIMIQAAIDEAMVRVN
jgi:SWI/SNF-related matrix-associated actin-dependent regulator 1 of chromatin subfamily A